MILNERQKKILEQEELPTDYEQLNFSQKSAIESIESFLKYLEKKYGDTFSYVSYTPTGLMNGERFVAMDEDKKELGGIEVTRYFEDDKLVYEDNYDEQVAAMKYKEELYKFIDERIPGKDASCFIKCEIFSYDQEYRDIITSANANICVALTGINVTQLDDLVEQYNEWMIEKKTSKNTKTRFFLIDEKFFKKINDKNIYDYMTEDYYIKCWKWFKSSEQIEITELK